MKKTLFITMLAAALVGSQVFAAAPIPTTTDAEDRGDGIYAGAYSETADVSGENVTINEETEGGGDLSNSGVYGGYTGGEQATASNNSVTMTGGQVSAVYGGNSTNGDATYNTASVSGGLANAVYGGSSMNGKATNNTATIAKGLFEVVYGGCVLAGAGNAVNNTVSVSGGLVSSAAGGVAREGNANNNTVTISGGQVEMAYGGVSNKGAGSAVGNVVYVTGGAVGDIVGARAGTGAATDNQVHLVGAGASVTVRGETLAGNALQVGSVSAATGSGTTTGNSIEIYGTKITAATLGGMQMLNFHLADETSLSQETMISLTSTSKGLNLTGVELGFYADAVQDWSAFEGQTITLVTAAQAITVGDGSLGKVEIKDADGATVATATLALGGSDDVLTLTNIKVPEPATGALSLLALAGLCARRRK